MTALSPPRNATSAPTPGTAETPRRESPFAEPAAAAAQTNQPPPVTALPVAGVSAKCVHRMANGSPWFASTTSSFAPSLTARKHT